MCDSWTGPTRMSVINFLIYCNGVMWFHKSIDASGRTQDATYLLKVAPKHVPFTLSMFWRLLKILSMLTGDSKGGGGDWTGACRACSHRQRLELQKNMQGTKRGVWTHCLETLSSTHRQFNIEGYNSNYKKACFIAIWACTLLPWRWIADEMKSIR